MIRAILLDLGGPVFNEDAEYQTWTELLVGELQRRGTSAAPEEFRRILEEEIARCEPNPWLSTVWRFVCPDLAKFREILAVFRARNEAFQKELPGVYVRPEAKKVIPQLLAERYELALAANQPPKALELLDEAGLLPFFRFKEVSETMGIAKPRPLFFRMILDTLGVRPEEAVMVGDRLDHDIFPARLLGLHTVRVQVGPYARQKPLNHLYVPEHEVQDLCELEALLARANV